MNGAAVILILSTSVDMVLQDVYDGVVCIHLYIYIYIYIYTHTKYTKYSSVVVSEYCFCFVKETSALWACLTILFFVGF